MSTETNEFENERPSTALTLIMLAVAAICVGAMIARIASPSKPATYGSEHDPRVGKTFPKLEVAGWLNGEPVTELRGSVYVVDAWAYWCGPCLRVAPHMVELEKKFGPKGAKFLGITAEGPESREKSLQFVARAKFTWPNAFGARKVFNALDIQAIPSVFVVDRTGTIVWTSNLPNSMEEAITTALESKAIVREMTMPEATEKKSP
jgi:thiol-disulfide isomerase/thioredoxin